MGLYFYHYRRFIRATGHNYGSVSDHGHVGQGDSGGIGVLQSRLYFYHYRRFIRAPGHNYGSVSDHRHVRQGDGGLVFYSHVFIAIITGDSSGPQDITMDQFLTTDMSDKVILAMVVSSVDSDCYIRMYRVNKRRQVRVVTLSVLPR